MMVLRKWLQLDIDELQKEVIKMANMVLVNIGDSLKAFEENDLKTAEAIKLRDDAVDSMEEEISKKALQIIWRQQPLASDLRLVTGILKLITDLERIGDHAIDIAKITIQTNKLSNERLIPLTTTMAKTAQNMVFKSIDAFFSLDEELARKTIDEDDKVDELFKQIIDKVIQSVKEDKTNSEYAIYLVMVAKYIERIGDHAVNICEWIIFILSGKHRDTPLF
ncbi:MAG TPA: phosphate signaling complex protein PhoU [Acholeplasmataceae bacterium]|nr:phosphate signaling complex protein PhoU [Acholeplasmataceae bacterium]